MDCTEDSGMGPRLGENSLPPVLCSRTPCPLSQMRSRQLSREKICVRQNLQSSAPPRSLILLKIPFQSLQKPILSLAPFLRPRLCQTSLGQRHWRQVVNGGGAQGGQRRPLTVSIQLPGQLATHSESTPQNSKH